MRYSNERQRGLSKGGAMVEFAITLPLLLGLCMAATDFGRLFYHAITIANAAGAGAFYGARDKLLTGHFQGQQNAAANDMRNITAAATGAQPVSYYTVQYCTCPAAVGSGGTGGTVYQDNGNASDPDRYGCNQIFSNPCTNYGPGRAYVTVTVRQPFLTLAPWPIIPSNTTVARTAFHRVQ